jgi:hypothetical protein
VKWRRWDSNPRSRAHEARGDSLSPTAQRPAAPAKPAQPLVGVASERLSLPGWSRTSDLRRPKPAGWPNSPTGRSEGTGPKSSRLLETRPGVGHGDENVTPLPQPFRLVDTPGGARTRSFRIESPASFRFDHRGARGSGGRDRTCASRLTVARLTARPHRNEHGGSRVRTCMAASHRRVSSALPFQVGDASKRKERESNPQSRSPPVFETGYRARWQSFQQVTPAGLEPARPRLRVGRSTELSYGARDVVGRARTCNAPRFRRALYLL